MDETISQRPMDLKWQARLIALASDANKDDMPCVEHTLLALVRMLDLPRSKQLAFARLMHDFIGVVI